MASDRKFWQVAAGSFGREYSRDFLRYGLAFVGGDEQTKSIKQVRLGDVIILKRGKTEIVAAGTVVERQGKFVGENDKWWLWDYDGWDLPAYCYVSWHVPEESIKTTGLTRATIEGVNQSHLREIAIRLVSELPSIPVEEFLHEEPTIVQDNDIVNFLVGEGLRPSAAEELTSVFRRIRSLASYYRARRWEDVREHETRTFLIIPLLLALGWSEQQIKIELPIEGRERVDVACFAKPYRTGNQDCVILLESKDFSSGLDYAHEQAKHYASRFPFCKLVAVSNGYCYKTYMRKSENEFDTEPSAYLNLLSPRSEYPRNPMNGNGCLMLLRQLMPQTWV